MDSGFLNQVHGTVTHSLRFLLTASIDYAGLFPPAQLSLDEARRNYARYREAPESWMLGRFICPTNRLQDLARTSAAGTDPFRTGQATLSVVGRGGKTNEDFLRGLHSDIEDMTASHLGVLVHAYEVRLPLDADDELITKIADALDPPHDRDTGRALFFEVLPVGNYRAAVLPAIDAIVHARNSYSDKQRQGSQIGLKLRCGGLEANAFPSPEQVASVLILCRDHAVPLKFTAGLHHPIRRHDPKINTHMHGFLNVLTAGVLASARSLGEDRVHQILIDEDADSFGFDDTGLQWKDCRATVAEIEMARKTIISFGSCSFDEPCDDLRMLGLI
jgi:hypothetical protein